MLLWLRIPAYVMRGTAIYGRSDKPTMHCRLSGMFRSRRWSSSENRTNSSLGRGSRQPETNRGWTLTAGTSVNLQGWRISSA
jgi:hypothetical protein